MIRVLIAEDTKTKADNIASALKKTNVAPLEIHFAESIIEANQSLISNSYDLLILDLNLPLRKGQDPKANGGLEIIDYFQASQGNLPLFIIGLTAFDGSLQGAQAKFNDELWSLIKYEESSIDWEKRIGNKLVHIAELKRNTEATRRRKYDYDLAIITAVEVEFNAAKKYLSPEWEEVKYPDDSTYYYTTQINIGGKKIKTVLGMTTEMGMTAASSLASKLIHNFIPKRIIMIGIAAGIKDEINLGDIIGADPSWDYSSGKLIRDKDGKRLAPDPRQIRINADNKDTLLKISRDEKLLLNLWKDWPAKKSNTVPVLKIGPMGSGGSVVADDITAMEIKEQVRKTIGIDMETYGVYFAASNSCQPRPDFLSIKAVCDFADSQKNDDLQSYCSYLSANVLLEYLKHT